MDDEEWNIVLVSQLFDFVDSVVVLRVHVSFARQLSSEHLESVDDNEASFLVFLKPKFNVGKSALSLTRGNTNDIKARKVSSSVQVRAVNSFLDSSFVVLKREVEY